MTQWALILLDLAISYSTSYVRVQLFAPPTSFPTTVIPKAYFLFFPTTVIEIKYIFNLYKYFYFCLYS